MRSWLIGSLLLIFPAYYVHMPLLFTSWRVIYLMLNVTYMLPRWHLYVVKLNTLQCLKVGNRWERTSSWSKEVASSNPTLNTPQSSICKAICGTTWSKEIAPGNPVWIHPQSSVCEAICASSWRKEAAIFCNPPLNAPQLQFSSTFLENTKSGLKEYIVTVHLSSKQETCIRSLQWSEEWPWTTHMSMRLQGKTRQ